MPSRLKAGLVAAVSAETTTSRYSNTTTSRYSAVRFAIKMQSKNKSKKEEMRQTKHAVGVVLVATSLVDLAPGAPNAVPV